MSSRFDKIYAEISTRRYNFNRDELEVEELKKLSREDVLKFFDEYIAANGDEKKKLSTHVISQVPSEATTAEVEFTESQIDDANKFKFGQLLYPAVQPYVDLKELSQC